MIKFALAGNPNCGKTTLFNNLTGATAHVGNWPGVTVEKRDGVYKKCPEPVSVVDLPGIYSLSPYTPEEVIARNYILDEKPDLIINIVDATNLERNLYLTTQILETDVPMVVALNMRTCSPCPWCPFPHSARKGSRNLWTARMRRANAAATASACSARRGLRA